MTRENSKNNLDILNRGHFSALKHIPREISIVQFNSGLSQILPKHWRFFLSFQDGERWADICVTEVIDACHFWAHVGGKLVVEKVEAINGKLLSQVTLIICLWTNSKFALHNWVQLFKPWLDNDIKWINLYPLGNTIGFLNTYPLESD